jgi:hypothetical protein
MSIVIQCDCGQALALQPERTGQSVRCPACAALLAVPEAPVPAAAGAVYGVEQALRKCPSCKRDCPEETLICVECGWDFRIGMRKRTTFEVLDRFVDFGLTFLGSYTRIAVHRTREGRLTLTRRSWLFFIPLGTFVLDLDGYEAVVTDYHYVRGGEIESETLYLELRGEGRRTVRIYEGPDEGVMKAIVDMLREVAHLRVERK